MMGLNALRSFRRATIARAHPALRGVAFLICTATLAACGDSPSGPTPSVVEPMTPVLTPVQIAVAQPLVSDTRVRLLVGITNKNIRDQVGADLTTLAARIAEGNSAEVRIVARRAATTLVDHYHYWTSGPAAGPDISAILLNLNSVARTAGSTDADISL